MFDMWPQRDDRNKFYFDTPSPWFAWQIPKAAKALQIFVHGAGGAGGNGFSRTAGSAGGGGGGGGSGGVASGLWPIDILGDTNQLWILIGSGGRPGTGGTDTMVSILPSNNANCVLSRALSAGNGGNGAAGAAGTAGTAGVAPASGNALLNNLAAGTVKNSGGVAGAAGGVHTGAAGGAITWGHPFASPGTGGAGCTTTDFAGGAFTGLLSPFLMQSIAGGLAAGGAGNHGIRAMLSGLPLATSGTGGGSFNSGTGGRGGDAGGPGAGGGGGGAGVTGGAGGNGGPGFVLIVPIY